jgi:hypothetical protein
VNPTSASIYTVTITGSNGCAATKTVGVNVYSPTVAITTASSSICDGQTALLNASTANSYTWNGAPGLNFLSVSPTVSTVYLLDATSFSAGISCVASTSILITVNPDPVVTIVATKTVLCKNEPAAVLSGSGAVTYTWSNAATTSTISASNQVSTNYFVNGTDANGCEGSSTSKLIKVDACTGISEPGQVKSFEVYPNPNNGTFNIVSDREMELNIINEMGQVVRHIQLSASNNHQVEIGDLAAGIYFINGASFNTKVVITK